MKSYYPNISEILSAKAERRQMLSALPWEEKVAIIEKMQQLLPKRMWTDRITDQTSPYPDQDAQRDGDGQAG